MAFKTTGFLAAALMAGAMVTTPVLAASSTPAASLVEINNDDVVVSSLGAKVGDLTGMEVYGADGKKIGDIGAVLADSAQKAQAVTIDVGGFLGVGTKNVIVPLERLQAGPKENTLSTAMTKAEIEQLAAWGS